ncbi:MAG: MFS transporter [Clostridiales bacterium]|jgi:DHA3 family macrolide efflux protein-like MFS transporter|nr:MFS transporter [Clostridiales bacterium]
MRREDFRKIVLYLTGQTITMFGSALVQYAITWHITLTTKSGLMLMISTLCGFLPQLIITPFAGVWADRLNRKRLIMLADGMIAVATALLALLFMMGYDDLWLLFAISAVRSLGSGIQAPSVGAFLPEIAPNEQLMRVNGVNASIQGAMMLVAPVAAGGLLEFMSIDAIFWIDVLTAFVGIGFLAFIKSVRPRTAQNGNNKAGVFGDIMSGLRYVAKTKWLLQFNGVYLFMSLMFGPVIFLTPLMVARSFGDSTTLLVIHEVVFAAGMTLGGLTVGIFAKKFRNKVIMVGIACAAFGIETLIMGFSPNFVFYSAVMASMGMTIPYVNSGAMTMFQTKVQPEYLGRVMSINGIIATTTMPLSMVIFGPISDSVSVETLLIITGALMTLMMIPTFMLKDMIAAGEPAREELAITSQTP